MNCFFCPVLPGPTDLVTVDAAEARHAATARRQKTGERVLLIDGRGGRAEAIIVAMDRSAMELRIESVGRIVRPRPEIVLATAVAKGDRQSTLLDMATQLGIAEYVPLLCERGVVKPDAHKVPRWRRICTQACKQSHNPYLPEIGTAISPLGFALAMNDAGTPLYLAVLGGELAPREPGDERVAVCIGPEGGFSRREVSDLIGLGARPLSLGPDILRIETAAVAAVSILGAQRG